MRNLGTFLGASVCLLAIVSARVFEQSPKPVANERQVRAVRHGISEVDSWLLRSPVDTSTVSKRRIVQNYGRLPLSFEANRGQTDSRVKFVARGSGYSLFLTGTETVLSLAGADASRPGSRAEFRQPSAREQEQGSRSPVIRAKRSAVLRMKLLGSDPAARVEGLEELTGKSNYFIGNDPAKWRKNVPRYAKVKYEQVYPGIDLVHYGNQQQLEYDFEVAPGTNPGVIRLSFQGAEGMEIDAQGDLVLHTAAGEIREGRPLVYQETASVRHAIAASYVLRGKAEVGFAVAQYDTSKPLVIDPTLSYSTYLGGSGNDAASGIAVDAAGNAYVTGYTNSTNFPTTPGSFQTAFGGASDAFVAKLNPAGDGLVYSTYLGGSSSESGNGIAVDAAGNAYVTGSTNSTNFPTTPGSFQTAFGGASDAFVTKLNSAGDGLVYSTYLGGSSSESGNGIAVDAAGNAYVTGYTNSTNFRTTPGSFQTAYGGGTDGFVTKLNPAGDTLAYSTYLGGRAFETAYGIAVDASDNAYVTGDTFSTDFPTANAFQPSAGGGTCIYYYYTTPCSDAFVTKLNPAGSALVFSTYLGGNQDDGGSGIVADSVGNAYVTGFTQSPNFPTTPSSFQTALGGTTDAFVTKLNPAGDGLVYSTYLGGSGFDNGRGIAVDGNGNAYVTGSTSSTNFPTIPGSFQVALNGFGDAFVTKLKPAGDGLVYSTYFGGSNSEGGNEIALDASGNAYVTGSTSSTNFPVTPGSYQTASGGSGDAFVAKISPLVFDGPIVTLSPTSLFFANQLVGTTSGAMSATLKNDGTQALTISGIAISGTNGGDFSQTNTCPISPSTLTPNAQCTFSVTFTPSTFGSRRGEVSITDNALGSPHKLNLTGASPTPGFSLSASPTARTIPAGQSATYTVSVTPSNGFTGTVTLGCVGAPVAGNCAISPASVSITAENAVTATATVSTTARSLLPPPPPPRLWRFVDPSRQRVAAWGIVLVVLLVTLAMLTKLGRRHAKPVFVAAAILLVLLCIACGGGSGGGGGGHGGTPPGTYTLTITGTSGGLARSTNVVLVVN